MARHDREDPHSLEEQLAWLDAIKENEETEIPAAVSAAADDAAGVSPYPKDPWLAVPSEPGPTPPPMFRAAVGSVYGGAPADGSGSADTMKIEHPPFTLSRTPTATPPVHDTPEHTSEPPAGSLLSPTAKPAMAKPTEPAPATGPSHPATPGDATGPDTLYLADSLLAPLPHPDFGDAFTRGPFADPQQPAHTPAQPTGDRPPKDGGAPADTDTGSAAASVSASVSASGDTGPHSFGTLPPGRSLGAFDKRAEVPSATASEEPLRGWLEPAVRPTPAAPAAPVASDKPDSPGEPDDDAEQARFAAFMAGDEPPDRDTTARIPRKLRKRDKDSTRDAKPADQPDSDPTPATDPTPTKAPTGSGPSEPQADSDPARPRTDPGRPTSPTDSGTARPPADAAAPEPGSDPSHDRTGAPTPTPDTAPSTPSSGTALDSARTSDTDQSPVAPTPLAQDPTRQPASPYDGGRTQDLDPPPGLLGDLDTTRDHGLVRNRDTTHDKGGTHDPGQSPHPASGGAPSSPLTSTSAFAPEHGPASPYGTDPASGSTTSAARPTAATPRRVDPLTDPNLFRSERASSATSSTPFGSRSDTPTDPGGFPPQPATPATPFGSDPSADRHAPAGAFGSESPIPTSHFTQDPPSSPYDVQSPTRHDRDQAAGGRPLGSEPADDPSPYTPESLASPTSYASGTLQEPKPYTPGHTADPPRTPERPATDRRSRAAHPTPEQTDRPAAPRAQHSRRRPAPDFGPPPRPSASAKPTADSLDPMTLLKGRRNAPSKGWRRLVYKASAGWIKPGEPPEVRRRLELLARARTPVASGHHRVAVLSLKGGVGKTTTTVGLGATLGQIRGDRVIAVDANPDRGTLSDKVVLETSATVRDLLNERKQIQRYVDIRAFTSQAPSRLEILASDRDPSISEAFSASDYQSIAQILENFYSICITDCGTGLLHSAMSGVLGLADQLVLVSSPSVDGARAASATLDWLEAHNYNSLVESATVVLCSVRPRSKSTIDLDRLEAHFAARCREVVRVPYDPHLEEGAEIDLDRLQPETRDAYLQLAAAVGDGFATPDP